MHSAARHQTILAQLRNRGALATRELQRVLGVTAMTVWRDLRLLEEQGLVRRTHGRVEPTGRVEGEPDFEAKRDQASEAKRRIAVLAAREFVRPGDTLALEGGTTVAALVEHLPETRVSLLTNSLPIALHARTVRPRLPVLVAGGWMSPISGNVAGPEALRLIARQSASVCFISATGFDAVRGPTDPNPLEIEAKRALSAIAHRVILLLDAGKFGRESLAVTLHPRRLHAVVTDRPPPPPIRHLLDQHQVRVLIGA